MIMLVRAHYSTPLKYVNPCRELISALFVKVQHGPAVPLGIQRRHAR